MLMDLKVDREKRKLLDELLERFSPRPQEVFSKTSRGFLQDLKRFSSRPQEVFSKTSRDFPQDFKRFS
jgi:hypothetical protein